MLLPSDSLAYQNMVSRRKTSLSMASFGPSVCAALLVVATTTHSFEVSAAPQNTPSLQTPEILLDGVVASVDEKPITLSEVQARLTPSLKISLAELSTNQDAQQALDSIILERILEAESTAKRISADDAEIEEYINEVAARNSLSRTDFEAVLNREGKTLTWYKHQVKNEILKTKLASSFTKGGVSVTEQEIDEYLATSPSFSAEGASVKIRLISISHAGRTPEEIQAKIQQAEQALSTGSSFSTTAQMFSDAANKADGGLLGVIAEKDLGSHISDAILSLEAGKFSKPVVTGDSTQIFFVEERFGARPSDNDESSSRDQDEDESQQKARREEARKTIQKRKTEEKLASYFGVELYKNHVVDKKF